MKTFLVLLSCLALMVCATVGPAEEAAAAKTMKFESPILITDVGQGNSSKLVEALLKRAGDIDFTTNNTAKVEDLGDAKTLIIGVGASSKGLGAAGLDANSETTRTDALLKAAEEAGVNVIGVHIGGIPRRGELSDGFNRQVFLGSDVFVAWEGGNEDDFFTNLAAESETVLIETTGKREVGDEIVKLLNDGYTATTTETKETADSAAAATAN